jgi:hypothetical protein
MSESSSLTTDQIGPIHPDTPATRQAARRTVAAHAHDTADAATLLAALGLEETP